MAHSGSIFLDEIGDLSLPLQAKLLRVLQEKEFERIGGTSSIQVDVRVIAATNQNLEQLVSQRGFREDLFFRLSVFPIHIPPLRQRKKDIPLLAEYFVEQFCRELNRRKMKLSEEAIQQLMQYSWPGNIRELQNCLERAVILCDGQVIENVITNSAVAKGSIADYLDLSGALNEVRRRAGDEAEKLAISNAWKEHGGSLEKTADALGISAKTLSSKLKELKLIP
jgi:transcriptional regulator with GAF, ATPase, and Fis domain